MTHYSLKQPFPSVDTVSPGETEQESDGHEETGDADVDHPFRPGSRLEVPYE